MKILPFLICLFLFLVPSASHGEESTRRGLFVTVIQDPPVLSSRQGIFRLVELAKKTHINVLFVQIYRANQAWFPSKVADQSVYESALKSVSEDPVQLLIKQAHAEGIEVHAWLNLLSLANNSHANLLKKYGAGILTRNLKKKKNLEDYQIDKQYFLEPGDPQVREELSTLVGEILQTYPELDGIQFDYIRYPDMDPAYGYTPVNMERFKKATGSTKIRESDPVWKSWKRDQVTDLLKILVQKTRAMRPHIQVSTTGCMPYVRAYEEAFQDWPTWVNDGLIDFVTVMSYSALPVDFEKSVHGVKSKVHDLKKLNIGIGAYAMADSPRVFAQEWEFCQTFSAGACVLFHYGSLLDSPALVGVLTSDVKSK